MASIEKGAKIFKTKCSQLRKNILKVPKWYLPVSKNPQREKI